MKFSAYGGCRLFVYCNACFDRIDILFQGAENATVHRATVDMEGLVIQSEN